MKCKPLFIVALSLLLFTSFFDYAQNPVLNYQPSPFPKSPNATAFSKYGDYPMNLFSGLPQINIPIYTVEAGSLKVPVSLSYHASGWKVDESAGWVGEGWNLDAGGAVTSNIMGLPDNPSYFGYKGPSLMNPNHFNGLDSLYAVVVAKTIDTRPDIYSYNFPGLSGKFFFDGTNAFKPVLIPYSPVQIKGRGGFDITDENGNVYTSGKVNVETTSTYLTNGNNSQAITAWSLEQMVSQNRRDTVKFEYQTQTIINKDLTGEVTTVEDQQDSGFSHSGSCGNYLGPTQTLTSNVSSSVSENEIKSIKFKNGRVDFILSTVKRTDLQGGPYALDSIKVYEYNYGKRALELQKSVKFYKSYFKGLSGTYTKLKLDSIAISDKAGAITQKYKFGYNQQPTVMSGSFSKDYWGYYNGKMDGSVPHKTLIPRTEIAIENNGITDSVYIGADNYGTRLPDSLFMQAGVLDSISYPTGGRTIFTYQTNRYKDGNNVTYLTGGLRVSSVTSYDNIYTTPIIKTYQYNVAKPSFITADGYGQLAYGFLFNATTYRNCVADSITNAVYICKTKRVRSYSSDPGYSLTSSDGNPVSYTTVTEYTGTPTSNAGKSIYQYSYLQDEFQSASQTNIPIFYDYFFARGRLLQKNDYMRKSDGSYQIVKTESNSYSAFPEKRYGGVGIAVGQRIINEGAANLVHVQDNQSFDDTQRFSQGSYGIVSDDSYLISNSITNYDLSDSTKSVSVNFSYNYGSDTTHQQILNSTHIDSKGNTWTANNKYAFNYPAGNAIIDSMVIRHMYAQPIEKTETYKIGSTTKVTSAQLYQFKTGFIANTIVPYKISALNIVTPITNFTASTVTSGSLTSDSRYVQMVSFDLYDQQNNITQYTPRSSTPISLLWNYLGEKPVMKVKNATSSYGYTSFEADNKGNFNYSGTAVVDYTAPTGTWVYPLSNGAITTPSTGVTAATLSYWSNNGPATVYAGSNITGSALKSAGGWTYYEHIIPASTGGATISGSTSIDELRMYPVDAQMTTYTYSLDGLTELTDARSSINSYEYDYFQRVKYMKDWNGNIVKNYGYHTYDQVVGNTAIAATSFTRNNCPPGTSPTSTTYSIPANKYYSATLASANADASYDLHTNGQIKANTICGCPIHYINYTLTNNTGHSGYQATFSGISTPFNFPATGSTIVQIPEGSYATVSVNPYSTFTATFTMGSRTPVTGHSASFSTVSVNTGSPDLTLTIQ